MGSKRKINNCENSSSEESRDSHKVDLVTIDDNSSDDEEKPVKKKVKKRKIVDSEYETTTSSSEEEDSDSSDSDFDEDKPCSRKTLCRRRKSDNSSSKSSLDQNSTTSSVSGELLLSSDDDSSEKLISSMNNNNTKSVEELQAEVRSLKSKLLKEKSARQKLEQENKELRAQLQQSSSGPRKTRLKSVYEGRKPTGGITRHQQLNRPWDPKNSEYLDAISKIKKVKVEGKEKWKCSLCDFVGTQKVHTRTHIARAHFDRQYPCSSCDKIFTAPHSLRTHVNAFHSGKKYKFTGVLPADLKVLELKPEDNEVICRSVLEEKDRDFLYDHWVCRYRPNPTSAEPPPHLFASGYTHKTDTKILRQRVNGIKRVVRKVDHSSKNKKKARNGCESIKKMKNLGFDLDSSTATSCGIICIGEMTAEEVKPVVRESLYATYSRNHLDSLDLLNEATALHIHDTLKDYIKEGESQKSIWNTWAKENIDLLVVEALNTNKNKKTGATVTKIIDHIERTRVLGATFLQSDIEKYLQKAVHDKSILSVDGQFKINM